MKPIYEISNEYLSIVNQIEANEGEITPEIETALAISEGELKQKGMAYVSIIKTIEGEVKTIDDEIKRLQALKKSRNGIVQNLKDRLEYALNLFGIPEIKTELHKVNFRKSKSVEIYDPELIPNSCKIVETVVSFIGKPEFKKRIEAGEDIPGVRIVENNNLQIK